MIILEKKIQRNGWLGEWMENTRREGERKFQLEVKG